KRAIFSPSTIPPIVVPFQAHNPVKYANARINAQGGPPTMRPKRLTRTISKNAAPIRSQKPAWGSERVSGRVGTASGSFMVAVGFAEAAAPPGTPGVVPAALCGSPIEVLDPASGSCSLVAFSGSSRRNPPAAAVTAQPKPHTLTTIKASNP